MDGLAHAARGITRREEHPLLFEPMTRRTFLRAAACGTGALALSACSGQAQRVPYFLLRRLRTPVGDILAYSSAEQVDILLNHSDGAS